MRYLWLLGFVIVSVACEKPADNEEVVDQQLRDEGTLETTEDAASPVEDSPEIQTRRIKNLPGMKWLSLCRDAPNLIGQYVPAQAELCTLQGQGVMPDEFDVPVDARPIVEPIEPVGDAMVAWFNQNDVVPVLSCSEPLPENLELVACSDEPVPDVIARATALRHLRAQLSKESSPDALLTALQSLRSLEHLHLSAPIDDSAFASIGKLTSLTALHLPSNDNTFTDAGLNYLRGLKSLSALRLRSFNATSLGMKSIGEVDGLRFLSLSSPRGFASKPGILAPLASLAELRRMDLELPGLQSSAPLADLVNLRVLRIHKASETFELQVPTQLRWLDLDGVPIEAVKTMQPAPQVREFSFQMNVMSKESAELFEAATTAFPNLKTLWVRGEVGPEAIDALAGAETLRRLAVCDIDAGTDEVDPNAMKSIQEMKTRDIARVSSVVDAIAKLDQLELVAMCGKESYRQKLAQTRPKLEVGQAYGLDPELFSRASPRPGSRR